jgi:GNAT superfamily N-acetyltransferase
MVMANNNWNINAEMKKNIKTKVVGGKVYKKIGNEFVLRNTGPSAPIRKYTANQLNLNGPGTRIYNSSRLENAMKVYVNAIQKQRNAIELLSVINKPAYNKAVRHLLSQSYVYDKLKTVGQLGFKNYTARAKNNKSLRGFAVIHNSRANGNRILNLLVTRPREGTGKVLMNRIINNAKKNGKSIRLNSVKSAVNFYKRFGFEPTGNIVGLTPMRRRV